VVYKKLLLFYIISIMYQLHENVRLYRYSYVGTITIFIKKREVSIVQ